MTTVVVSIGRNVPLWTSGKDGDGVEPMSDDEWGHFKELAVRVVTSYSPGTIYATASGIGEWESVQEETFVVIGDVDRVHLGQAKRDAHLAGQYFSQEAVGFVVHDDRQGDSLA